MFKFVILAASAALASAYTTPVAQCTDSCNPIAKPGLNEVVPAGSDYTVTWQPTTDGTVTLVLMKGPSNNIQPLYAIAEKIANTGTYTWKPAADLEPTGDSGYGFQLIDDADGSYQWSTQFGISNGAYSGSASGSASASASAIASSSAAAGNVTISSAITTGSAAPTGYSNSTAVISSPSTATGLTTLSTASVTSGSSSPSSSAVTSSNGAVAVSALSVGGVFAVIMAAVAAL